MKLQSLQSISSAIGHSSEKEKYKTFDIKLSKKEKDSEKVEISVRVFENGTLEEFCKWYEEYHELEEMMPLDTAAKNGSRRR